MVIKIFYLIISIFIFYVILSYILTIRKNIFKENLDNLFEPKYTVSEIVKKLKRELSYKSFIPHKERSCNLSETLYKTIYKKDDITNEINPYQVCIDKKTNKEYNMSDCGNCLNCVYVLNGSNFQHCLRGSIDGSINESYQLPFGKINNTSLKKRICRKEQFEKNNQKKEAWNFYGIKKLGIFPNAWTINMYCPYNVNYC